MRAARKHANDAPAIGPNYDQAKRLLQSRRVRPAGSFPTFRPDPHQVPVWTFCKLSTVLITVQSPVPLNHTLSPAA